jgi:hypothetical protein
MPKASKALSQIKNLFMVKIMMRKNIRFVSLCYFLSAVVCVCRRFILT